MSEGDWKGRDCKKKKNGKSEDISIERGDKDKVAKEWTYRLLVENGELWVGDVREVMQFRCHCWGGVSLSKRVKVNRCE